MEYRWKANKRFAFSIVDDTDYASISNTKPVYDYLYEKGIITTKTVWVYPPRDDYEGDCIQSEDYRNYILDLQRKGFEIAFHEAGSGKFLRDETIYALKMFKDVFGQYPKIHINHSNNPGGIYWGADRFSPLIRLPFKLYKKLTKSFIKSCGADPKSECFWGDECKKHVKYIRNRVFTDINLLNCDKNTPYREKHKDKYSNYWFSSCDAIDADAFVRLITKENIDRLQKENGCSIVYLHFAYGYVNPKTGQLREDVKAAIDYLAEQDGWFAPAGEILDFLLEHKRGNEYISPWKNVKLDIIWLFQRVIRRFLYKI